MEKTHIRKLQESNYLGEWDLPEQNNGKITVTILKVERQEVAANAKEKSMMPVVYFKEYKKGMVFNKTNQKAGISACGTPYIEDWVGKQIELFRLEKVKAFGEYKDAIRVTPSAPKPKEKEELTETHARFEGAVKAIKDGKATIELIEKTFKVSETTKRKIQELCK